MNSSTDSDDVKLNIINHIANEERYMPRPYIDPNHRQANIGYGHTFYEFKPQEIAASRQAPNRDAYLLSILKPEYKKMYWDKRTAAERLWRDFSTHRNVAQEWLEDNGIKAPGRLLDQLGMLFFGSNGLGFRKSSGAKIALQEAKRGNFDTLSAVASRWGRAADGKPLLVLAKRRDAERKFFLGNPLPEKREQKDPALFPTQPRTKPFAGKDWAIPAAPSGLDLDDDDSPMLTQPGSSEAWDDLSTFRETILGTEGRRKADELTWQLFGDGGPMPDDFDSVSWAQGVVGELDAPQETMPTTTNTDLKPVNMGDVEKALEKFRVT